MITTSLTREVQFPGRTFVRRMVFRGKFSSRVAQGRGGDRPKGILRELESQNHPKRNGKIVISMTENEQE